MKRLFLLIAVCMIGMVLPQVVLAETYTADGVVIVVNGKTVTVNSTKAGALSTYLNSGQASDAIAAIQRANGDESSIVFDGDFNANDLSKLSEKNCCVQKKVDMAEAKFIKSNSSSGGNETYLFVSDDQMQNKSEGDHCIVGATKYRSGSANSTDFVWNVANYDNGSTLVANENPQRYSTLPEAGDAPHDYNTVILVGGTDYVFHNGQWVSDSQGGGGNNEYDYTQMKFSNWGSNVEEIITSKYAEGPMADQLCSGCSNLKTLTLSAGDFTGTTLGNNITKLETVNIQNQVTALGSGMFNQAGKEGTGNDATQHLTTVTFQDGCQIRTLPNSVFKDTGIRNLSVPSSVELIEAEAFSSCQNLEVVTFVDTNHNPLVIKNNAFQQSDHIKHIYLNVDPSERLLICEYNAFDYHSMEGQTAEGSEMATLHFAEENFDYYAGEWKKGMAFKQADLNSFKDGIRITDDQGNVIYAKPDTQNPGAWGQYGFGAIESYGEGNVDGYYHNPNGGNTKYAPANGWQQFAKIESKREIEITGNVYMTYSTATPYSLPKGIVAFRVTDYKYAVKNAKGYDTKGTLILKAIDQVPTETGMLLISTSDYVIKTSDVNANPNVQSVFYFGDPDGEPAKYHYTMGKAGELKQVQLMLTAVRSRIVISPCTRHLTNSYV